MAEETVELIEKDCIRELLRMMKEYVSEDDKVFVENAMYAVERFSTITITYRYDGRIMDE